MLIVNFIFVSLLAVEEYWVACSCVDSFFRSYSQLLLLHLTPKKYSGGASTVIDEPYGFFLVKRV